MAVSSIIVLTILGLLLVLAALLLQWSDKEEQEQEGSFPQSKGRD